MASGNKSWADWDESDCAAHTTRPSSWGLVTRGVAFRPTTNRWPATPASWWPSWTWMPSDRCPPKPLSTPGTPTSSGKPSTVRRARADLSDAEPRGRPRRRDDQPGTRGAARRRRGRGRGGRGDRCVCGRVDGHSTRRRGGGCRFSDQLPTRFMLGVRTHASRKRLPRSIFSRGPQMNEAFSVASRDGW